MYKLFLKYRRYYLSFFPFISYKSGFIMDILIVMFSLIKKLNSMLFCVMFFEYIKKKSIFELNVIIISFFFFLAATRKLTRVICNIQILQLKKGRFLSQTINEITQGHFFSVTNIN